MSTPAGWYPDTQQPGFERFWDGAVWTEERRPTAPATPAPVSNRTFAAGESLVWEGRSQSMTAKATGGHAAAKYTLTSLYLYFEKGMLSTNAQQVPVSALHDIDVKQSMSQKARGVGDVIVRFDRGGATETVVLESISDFRNVQRMLNETSHAARLAIMKVQNTHHYEGGVPIVPQVAATPPAPTPAPAPAAPAADPMDQLRKLGELRDSGILSEEEFAAKKADILARM